MAVTNKLSRRERIKFSIRKKFSGTTGRPRLTVFRSNSEIYAQIIDDTTQKTVVSVSSLKEKGTKTEKAKAVGAAIAGKAKDCLLYTSDAADERSSVDLGGRRIIKKKNTNRHLSRRLIDRIIQ